jgi:hypothetical protein
MYDELSLLSFIWRSLFWQSASRCRPKIVRSLLKAETHRTRFDNAARFFSFWKLIKQPMNGNFKRYVDQITQNVIALLNIWKTRTTVGSKLSVSENRKIASRCRIASSVSGTLHFQVRKLGANFATKFASSFQCLNFVCKQMFILHNNNQFNEIQTSW